MNDHLLAEELREDEGEKLTSYLDSKGYWTIGVGRLIDPKRGANPAPFGIDLRNGGKITAAQSEALLLMDIKEKSAELDRRLPWWRTLSDNRQRVLANMAHQMGVSGLLGFKKALAAIRAGEYVNARLHMLDSDWSRHDSPKRARRLADRMVQG